jgi:hypothetical protein
MKKEKKMATHYTITVKSLNGEFFVDTVESDLKGHLASLATDPTFNLGEHIATRRKRVDEYESFAYHYYHNGRIIVRTARGQYTAAQRQGRRRF